MGIKAFRKLQMGRETVAGTAVAATSLWRGLGTIEDTREQVDVDEDIGLFSGADRTYQGKLGALLSLESIPATFEQFPHILEAGIVAVGTGVADGAGSGKIYDYPVPEAAASVIKTYTWEGGDNEEVEEMEHCFVQDFGLDGKPGEAWMVSANWIGRQVSISSYTGAIAVPTVEDMLFSKTKFYIDAVASAYGTTLKSSTLLGASLKFKTGWKPVWTADGQLYFSTIKAVKPEITLDLTLEFNGTSVAEKVNWRAQTPRKIQLKCEGSALTPGTTYSYKTMIVNLVGKWDKFSKIGEAEGNDIVTGTFRGKYNATAADAGNIIVVNTLATIP